MKYLIILYFLITFNVTLKRLKTRHSFNMMVRSICSLPELTRPKQLLINQPTELLFEYNDSIIIINKILEASNGESEIDYIESQNPPQNINKLPITFDIELCGINLDICYKIISPQVIYTYKLTFTVRNADIPKNLEEILKDKRKALLWKVHDTDFADEILNFNYMSKIFKSLSFYNSEEFENISTQYFDIAKKFFTTDETFFKEFSDNLKEDVTPSIVLKYFEDHARSVFETINSKPFKILNVKEAIFSHWKDEWLVKYWHMQESNRAGIASYAWVLAQHFDSKAEGVKKVKDLFAIFRFIYNIICISPKEEELINSVIELEYVDFPHNLQLKTFNVQGIKVTQETFEESFKIDLTMLISDLTTKLKSEVGKQIKIKIPDILI
jgi:acyl carrier protein phosphodiesterase